MCIPHFVYPVIHRWILGLLSPFGCVNNAAVNMDVQISAQNPAFSSFGYIPRRRIAELLTSGNGYHNMFREYLSSHIDTKLKKYFFKILCDENS